jgi:MATE family multidrug resistance protein
LRKNIIRLTFSKLRQDLTLLFSVGLPLVLNNISSLAVNVADTLMASAMGTKQLAAVALGSGVWISLFLFGLGILI